MNLFYLSRFVLSKSKELSAQCSEPPTKNIIHQLREADIDSLWKFRKRNINRILIGSLNINPVSSKFDQLKCLLQGKVNT